MTDTVPTGLWLVLCLPYAGVHWGPAVAVTNTLVAGAKLTVPIAFFFTFISTNYIFIVNKTKEVAA